MSEETKLILNAIGEIKEDVSVLKEDVSVLKEDVSVLKEDVSVLKEDVSGLKEDVSVLKEDVSDLKERVSGLEEGFCSSREEQRNMRLYMENVLEKKIQIIAEGHLDLNKKLDEALKKSKEDEAYRNKVDHHEYDIKKIKGVLNIA